MCGCLLVVTVHKQALVNPERPPSLTNTLVEEEQVFWNSLHGKGRQWSVMHVGKCVTLLKLTGLYDDGIVCLFGTIKSPARGVAPLKSIVRTASLEGAEPTHPGVQSDVLPFQSSENTLGIISV